MNLDLRIPGQTAQHQHRFEFIDDTGCDMMSLYEGNLTVLQNLAVPPAPKPSTMGAIVVTVANGERVAYRVRAFCVNIYTTDPDPQEMVQWDWVQCMMKPSTAEATRVPQLAGPWLRSKLFTATAPDGQNRLWVHTARAGGQKLPPIDTQKNPPARPTWLVLQDMLSGAPVLQPPLGTVPP